MTAGEESSGAPSPLAVQARVLAYWEATGVPASVLAGRPDGPIFRFTEGPPTANGAPHLGHLVARVLKDVELRYRRMRGMHIVSPMAGWDCHGLPVELEIEKRHYVLPYCPRCETPLSSHEVAQGYRETTDPSITVRFPLDGPPGEKRELLVWTTTPWTLPANLLVAARADLEYSVVQASDGRELVLASAAVSRYFPEGVDVVERFPGTA